MTLTVDLLRLQAIRASLSILFWLGFLQTGSLAFFPPITSTTSRGDNVHSDLRAGASDEGTMCSKYVLVTGGNKGIGKAICQKLLQEYSDVAVLLGSRNIQRGHDAVADLQKELGFSTCEGRLFAIPLDVSSDESVKKAVPLVQEHTNSLYGIVNNAGILMPHNVEVTTNVNYFGPRRVTEAFRGMLQNPGGRIVNIGSASGPIFVSNCRNAELYNKLACPWKLNGAAELDKIAREPKNGRADPYGFSKALVSAYTWLLAKEEPELTVNAVTPGYIKTDMTAGTGASNPPSKGAGPPTWLLMSEEVKEFPTGRYYGSDCKRSPLDEYRGPGDPVYEGPDGK